MTAAARHPDPIDLADARSSTCVIRVWYDPNLPERLLGRLLTTDAKGEPASRAAVGVDAICDALRDWLRQLDRDSTATTPEA